MKKIILLMCVIGVLLLSSVSADQKVVSTENDFKDGSFSSMQLNFNPSHACDTSRYTSAGYDYPDTSTNPSGTCNQCDGYGNIQLLPSGQDPFNECSTANCLTGTCNGAGACGYYTSGQQNCAGGYECSAEGVCTDPSWISGSCSGIEVYYIDVVDLKSWGPTATDCRSPQCAIGLDLDYPLKYSLVADNTVSFSSYPARDACKAVGGRLPTMNELACISDNSGDYGTFVSTYYWSSTEYNAYNSRILWISSGSVGLNGKLGSKYVRCVRSE